MAKPADNKTALNAFGLFRSLIGISTLAVRVGHIAERERFGDVHRRDVSNHFQLLAVIIAGGYPA